MRLHWVVNDRGEVVRRPYLAASDPSDENGVAVRPFFTTDTVPGQQIITAGWGDARTPNGVAPTPSSNPITVSFTATATPRR